MSFIPFELKQELVAKDTMEHARGGFSPYSMNGGTLLGIAGNDYCLVASDTRLCEADYYMIYSRRHPHIWQMTPSVLVGGVGFQGDCLTFMKMMQTKVKLYQYEFGRSPDTSAIAQMISIALYNRRFFPYYVYNMVAGLDAEGRGALYTYDPVGNVERALYRAEGNASAILQPFLDNQIGRKNQGDVAGPGDLALPKEDAVKLAHDIFISAAERDICCGDGVVIQVVTAAGVENYNYQLRKD
ncbi:hypothetical protein BOX15_Mlig015406g1 [Macrostomum lignano]|uniref:Uncharacterized protein n=3 Tax=Macrostomum lignano TaxID=282301 RepID=A0A267DXZ1_9PLAT|nr:hypothetical protein BOX15_Mlig015406g2 [Macrostomum lignano]PAA72084.1 hypothetical protein BOX15_Mlig015406g1 [Macrostomum lignano]